MVLKSYAKLNLYLKVLSLRKDNYHNLKILFERIDLSDKIILKPRRDKFIKIRCNNPGVPCDAKNLCYRSAELLQDKFRVKQGLDIKIIKRVPVGAGLGGGSSNAAAVLLGLNKLWKLDLSKERLARLARKIGCDVPFFIYEVPFALGTERGDKIRPLKNLRRLRLWHVLVVPKMKASTPLVYKKWDEFCAKKTGVSGLTPTPISRKSHKNKLVWGLTKLGLDVKILSSGITEKALAFIDNLLFNSLEPVTIKLYPEVERVKLTLERFGVKSILMSGSGPAVFGVVSSRKEAVSLRKRLRKLGKPWQVFATRTF